MPRNNKVNLAVDHRLSKTKLQPFVVIVPVQQGDMHEPDKVVGPMIETLLAQFDEWRRKHHGHYFNVTGPTTQIQSAYNTNMVNVVCSMQVLYEE